MRFRDYCSPAKLGPGFDADLDTFHDEVELRVEEGQAPPSSRLLRLGCRTDVRGVAYLRF